MCHTFKHFIHMKYFLLLTNLVIVVVRWVSTGVLYEPRQCSLFWDYIPESKLCFCAILCRLSGPYSIRPIQKLLNCQTTTCGGLIHSDGWRAIKTALWLWGREMTWYLNTRGVRGRMKANQRWYKVTRELCHKWFHNHDHVRHYVRLLDWRIRHSHLTSTLFHSIVPWWRPRRTDPAPENSPQSIGELRNGHKANLQELLHQTG